MFQEITVSEITKYRNNKIQKTAFVLKKGYTNQTMLL